MISKNRKFLLIEGNGNINTQNVSKKTALLSHLCENTGTKNKAENLVKSRLPVLFVASPPGFEPGASGLGGSRSILLSYGDTLQSLLYHSFAILSNVYLTKKLARHSNKYRRTCSRNNVRFPEYLS